MEGEKGEDQDDLVHKVFEVVYRPNTHFIADFMRLVASWPHRSKEREKSRRNLLKNWK